MSVISDDSTETTNGQIDRFRTGVWWTRMHPTTRTECHRDGRPGWVRRMYESPQLVRAAAREYVAGRTVDDRFR